MKLVNLITVFFLFLLSCNKGGYVTISGTVTDFDNNSIENVSIEIKDKNFKTIDSTLSDKDGKYKFEIKKGSYYALSAVSKNDYAKRKLEYWAWNIPAYKSLKINIKSDKLELYGVNIFKIQGAFPAYSIYVRPMSLSMFHNNSEYNDTINLAPELDKVKFKILLDGQNLNLYSIQKLYEYAGKQRLVGYFIQAEYKSSKNKFGEFDITAEDNGTGDKGEAKYYFENKN